MKSNFIKKIIPICISLLFFLIQLVPIVNSDVSKVREDIIIYNLSTQKKTYVKSLAVGSYRDKVLGIFENIIVWSDGRNGKQDPETLWSNIDIYIYDISTRHQKQITKNTKIQDLPAIYGDKIVWVDWRNDEQKEVALTMRNTDIYLYNLSNEKEKQITKDLSYQSNPEIYNDIIVWEEKNGEKDVKNIYYYDLLKDEEIKITDDDGNYVNPSIYGNTIIFQDTEVYDIIYLYDISTGNITNISNTDSAAHKEARPVIYGDKIIWADATGGLYIYNLLTKNITKVQKFDYIEQISIYENTLGLIVGMQLKRNIYIYDISTGEDQKITEKSENRFDIGIYGDNVVWAEYLYDSEDELNTRDSSLQEYLLVISIGIIVVIIIGVYKYSCKRKWKKKNKS